MHCVLLALEICPSRQAVQVVCPAAEISSLAQASHELFAAFSKVPAAQAVHCVLLAFEICPSGQAVQVVCPAADIVPLAQASHECVVVL